MCTQCPLGTLSPCLLLRSRDLWLRSRPPQHQATWLGVINVDAPHTAARAAADKKKTKNWLTPVWPHTPSIHWLLGIDEVINDLFLSVSGENTDAHRCCRGYVQGLGKSRRKGCQGSSVPKPPLTPRAKKRKGFIKAEAVFGTFPKESILRNLLVSFIIMWCVCIHVRTWAHLNLPWVWLICAESGWTQGTFPPSLQSDDATGSDALPWQQVCVCVCAVNDSWATVGVRVTWLAFKPTPLWRYHSRPFLTLFFYSPKDHSQRSSAADESAH